MASTLAATTRRAFTSAFRARATQPAFGSLSRLTQPVWSLHKTSFKAPTIILTAQFSSASGVQYTKKGRPGPGEGFTVNFVMQDGEEISVQAHEGESLLDVAWANDIDIEGACEASLACSTCHVILDPESYNKLEEPIDEENDMLDLAFGLTDTSRLGCQVLMNKDLDGIIATLPKMTRNA
ncbi:hypothetical protein EDD11_001846 [Mortierella claussenii]|nr:hypothetical protein EDD11_001846 [Mortierella claussenii]